MLTIDCPNCGAPVTFRSAGLPDRVCDHCRSMLVRSDSGVAIVGVQAALPFDVSPLQIGTRGRFDGRPFEIVGRVRWSWTDGSWNEWLCLFGDNGFGWLGEAMGQFMMTFERPMPRIHSPVLIAIQRGADAPIGDRIELEDDMLTVADAREVECIAAEGELPFTAPPGWRIYSVDFRTTSGRVANMQRDGDEAHFYDGRYVTLAELQPAGLRAIDGWAIPANG
ncbi:DUF4178 domain-containing protein [Sphingomonas qomolangmaensis]|uniref:DUF4178 domain-containing protein n=1 Tax=Sphingomonas qomolangmaensis TaxID=2918765 RepID=A0ABY5L7T1_9SPHN|nr:DUF4178 domain-containing protein [Sphingomonas qomolangmaensis]UUL81859.1 DUF4178 domain-containing protein [Sphingomonas qomolangmaensis]